MSTLVDRDGWMFSASLSSVGVWKLPSFCENVEHGHRSSTGVVQPPPSLVMYVRTTHCR